MRSARAARARRLALACAALLLLAEGARAQLVAERITADRFDGLVVGGPDADAGVGDYALQNGRVCAAISSGEHESALSDQGGVLVDLGLCGRHDDQWSTLQPLLNLDQHKSLAVESIEPELGEGEARVRVTSGRDGVRVVSTYTVGDAVPDELRITTEVTRREGAERVFAFGEVALHANGQIRPFALWRPERGLSHGFHYPGGGTGSLFALLDAMVPADAVVLVGSPEAAPPLSYGIDWRRAVLRRADGTELPLPRLANIGESHSLLGVLAEPPWLGGVGSAGLLALAQMPFMNLAPGDALVIERAILVEPRADVAGLTDRLFPDEPWLHGSVDEPHASVYLERPDGAPLTAVRPDAVGRFAARVPEGPVRVRVVAPGARSATRDVEVSAAGADVGRIATGAVGWVSLPHERTVRLVFQALDGAPEPRFGDDGWGFRVGGEAIPSTNASTVLSLAGIPDDPENVPLAPGRYRVLASRGLEYAADVQEIEVRAGETTVLEVPELARALETPGWIGADLHVHSAGSFDSAFPLAHQLAALAAGGVEVMVSTEHDHIVDPAPWIAALGLGDRLRGIAGVEATGAFNGGDAPSTSGHLNAFPLPRRPHAYRGGAPRYEGRRLGVTLAELRRTPGLPPILQLNHPRATTPDAFVDQDYFTHLGVGGPPYDPRLPLTAEPNRALLERAPGALRDVDFDAMELLNGPRMERYRLVRADWLSLLLQGEVRTATANSDSHGAAQLQGVPRNYVALADDRLADFDEAAFLDAVRAGRCYGTSGPILDVRLGDAGPGERYAGREGTLHLAVRAAPWVPVDRARVYVDGALAADREVHAGDDLEIPLSFAADAFVTVEVTGTPDAVYAALAPDFTPLAFSNPVLVDADGDGAWTPPGLPDPLPDTLARPLDVP